jgi:hypothetical protein
MKQTFFVELTREESSKLILTGRVDKENKDVRIVILRGNTVNIV